MRTKQVECIVFRKKEKFEFLLLKRVPEKGSFWQPPCGGVEQNDKSLLDACYREIEEETSISKDKVIKVIEEVYQFTMHNDYLTGKESTPLTEYVFGFEVKPDVKVKLDANICVEHEQFQWVPFDKAIEMLKWNDNKEAFKALYKILTKR
ncbi:NUDIX domain-containing protein [Candidatus Woesearchaeota archaeon]|nr:NUDIX domain-containing protein [Candidatus Woesearchaeota archaeon]